MATAIIKRKRPNDLATMDPFFAHPFRMMRDFDSIFDDFRRNFDDILFKPMGFDIMPRAFARQRRIPAIDLLDRGNSFQLVAELPGINREDLDVSITDGRIEIKAEHRDEKKEEKDNYLYQERSYMNFHRAFDLPQEIISDNAEAKLEDGILTISLPKKELPESSGVRKLEIK